MTVNSISNEQFDSIKSLLESMIQCSKIEDKNFCQRYAEEIIVFLEDLVK